jgi:hypothetical protein
MTFPLLQNSKLLLTAALIAGISLATHATAQNDHSYLIDLNK